MNTAILKQALIAARDRISEYNQRQRMHTVLGQGTAVDNKTDAEVLKKIDAALDALKSSGKK